MTFLEILVVSALIVLSESACPFPEEWITPCPCSSVYISTDVSNCKGRVDFEHSAQIMDALSKETEATAKIEELDLAGLNIQTIENKAFYYMDSLKKLSFSRYHSTRYEKLKHIKSDAFVFRRNLAVPLNLDISYNNLNSSNFDNDVFKNANRPMIIAAYYNSFQVLDEQLFYPFFAKFPSNNIALGRAGIICENCESAWIVKNNFTDRINQSFHSCHDLITRDPHFFDKCK